MAGSSDNKVTLSIQWEGMEKALQDISRFRQELDRLGTGSGAFRPSSASAGSGPLPQGASPSAPTTPDPYSGYRPPSAPQGASGTSTAMVPLGYAGAGGWWQSQQSPSGPAPGEYAPPAPGVYRLASGAGIDIGNGVTAFPPEQSSGGGGGGGIGTVSCSTMTVSAQTVVVSGSVVSGGAGGGGGAGGAGGVAGAGGSAFGLGDLASLFGGGGSTFGGGSGFLQGFLSKAGSMTSGAGILRAALGFPGGAAIWAGLQIAGTLSEYGLRGSQPTWQLGMEQRTAQLAGKWLDPFSASADWYIAQSQGEYSSKQGDPYAQILGDIPIYKQWWEENVGRPIIEKGKERAARVEYSHLLNIRHALVGGNLPVTDPTLDLSEPMVALASMMPSTAGAAAMFGKGTDEWIANMIGKYGKNGDIIKLGQGWSLDDLLREQSSILRASSVLGNDQMLQRILNSQDWSKEVKGYATEAGQYFASTGDVFAVRSLLPDLGKEASDQLLTTAMQVRSLQITQQYGQAAATSASAGVEYARGTGAGYESVATAIGKMSGPLKQQANSLRQQAAIRTNPLEAAQLNAQADQLEAQAASIPQQQTRTLIGGEMTLFSAYQSMAETQLTKAMYGGGSAEDVVAAYGGLRRQAQSRAAQFLANATRPGIPPEEAEEWRARAAAEEVQASILIPRQAGQFQIGYGTAQLGVLGAQVQSGITMAQLFGAPLAQYQAGMGQVGLIQKQQEFANWQLANAGTLGLSQTEQLQLQRELVDLKRQEVAVTQQVIRSYYSMSTSIASTERGIAQTQQGRATITGIGGTAAVPYWEQSMKKGHEEIDAIDREIKARIDQGQDPNSPEIVALKAKREVALTNLEQTRGGIANTPMPYEFRMAQRGTEFAFNVMSRTYLPWGNQRGALVGLMGYAGQELQTINDLEKKARQSGEWQPWMEEAFQQRRIDVGNRMVGYQQQYESGFMDRLISSVYNAPQSMAFVASRFTQMEAAPFMQMMGPAWGFSSTATRDFYRDRYPRLANSLIGQLQKPEGFISTGMSGAQPPTPMGDLTGKGALGFLGGGSGGPELTVHIVVHDTAGKELGRESQRVTIGDMTNGALSLTLPMMGMGWAAGGAAHQ